MKILKITMAGMETYTGFIGMVEFENGVSKTPVPQIIADRVSAAIPMVEIDEAGDERQANPAARMGSYQDIELPVADPLSRATDAELAEEQRRIAMEQLKCPADRFYTVEELEEIADKEGIKGLRRISDLWNVKDRAIPNLIRETIKAQAAFQLKVEELARKMPTDQSVFAADAVVESFTRAVAETPTDATAEARFEPVTDEVGFVGSDEEIPASEMTEPAPLEEGFEQGDTKVPE